MTLRLNLNTNIAIRNGELKGEIHMQDQKTKGELGQVYDSATQCYQNCSSQIKC
jgi:hypothetical protein